MEINEIGQKMSGGVPMTELTAGDIVMYHGAIVGTNTSGDLFTWDGESNTLGIFTKNLNGNWNYSLHCDEDFDGRDLNYVMELVEAMYSC